MLYLQRLKCSTGESTSTNTTCQASEACMPLIQCSAQLDSEENEIKFCSFGEYSSGVCCEEISSFESNAVILEKPKVTRRSIRSVSQDELRIALEVSTSLISNASMGRPQLNTNGSGWSAFSQQADPGVIQLGKNCLIAMETAKQLANRSNRKLFIWNLCFKFCCITPCLHSLEDSYTNQDEIENFQRGI